METVESLFVLSVKVNRLFYAVLLLFFAGASASASSYRLSAFGDSLMAGYGLSVEQGFIARLQYHLEQLDQQVLVLNHAISGNTSADALARVQYVIDDRPDGVLLGFGGNDVLRKVEPDETMKNLEQMIIMFKEAGIEVLLIGMKAPLNWGISYKFTFDGIYEKLAAKHDLMLYPFFLEGVAREPRFNLPDGLHPNAAGIELITEGILHDIVDLIESSR